MARRSLPAADTVWTPDDVLMAEALNTGTWAEPVLQDRSTWRCRACCPAITISWSGPIRTTKYSKGQNVANNARLHRHPHDGPAVAHGRRRSSARHVRRRAAERAYEMVPSAEQDVLVRLNGDRRRRNGTLRRARLCPGPTHYEVKSAQFNSAAASLALGDTLAAPY